MAKFECEQCGRTVTDKSSRHLRSAACKATSLQRQLTDCESALSHTRAEAAAALVEAHTECESIRADLATVQEEKERLEFELRHARQAAALKEQQCEALLVKIGSLQNQVNVAYAGVLLHRNCQMPPLNVKGLVEAAFPQLCFALASSPLYKASIPCDSLGRKLDDMTQFYVHSLSRRQ